jgi:hypothetical protein
MKTFLLLCVAVLPGASVFAQGSLTPPGAPAPTMKTLAQIEPRTPISSAPFTITTPGSYYLTTNLTVSGGDAITIAANGVTLDLNGFTIASTAASAAGYGILINNGLRNLAILNGFIQGGVTNGGGVYSGSGFGYGIYGFPQNARVSGVSVSDCLYSGIHIGNQVSTVVESCTVQTVGNLGIYASIIKSSTAVDCGNTGINGNQVADSRGESSSSYGVQAYTAQNCYGSSSSSATGLKAFGMALNCYGFSSSGTGLEATTAQNCYGICNSGVGLNATTAQNCYGYSGTGTGLSAYTAQNCQGISYSDAGLNARTALNCYGNSYSGSGLIATTAQSCYGESTSGTGLIAYHIAIGCSGQSFSGTGLNSLIANSCHGASTASAAQDITHPYNMP